MMVFLPLFSQDVSQERMVRFALWASTEIYPGIEEPQKDTFSLPVKKIREISPFIISGMVYGWNFEYTPYDKSRNVAEYFEFTPINELAASEISSINYAKPRVEESRLYCWVEFRRSDEQVHIFKGWSSVLHPRIKGEGYAPLSQGFEGIQSACGQALKAAIRDYERKWIKSKPKEISGKVLLREPPKIGVDAGRYKITLDFFMETDRIIEYKTF